MKKLLAIVAMTMTLTTCGITAGAVTPTGEVPHQLAQESFIDVLIELKEAEQADLRAKIIQTRIQSLYQHVHKTWYVFSGTTPDGWDCSGMVMWFYSELGIELEHSVTAQMESGRDVSKPLPGDVVAFKHIGAASGYHNGIYLGGDLFVHSPRAGTVTKVSSVSEYAGQHSQIIYTRIGIPVVE
jgi:cell wall-associated NlpC family hydrolase